MKVIGVNIKDDENYARVMNLIDECLNNAGIHHETFLERGKWP